MSAALPDPNFKGTVDQYIDFLKGWVMSTHEFTKDYSQRHYYFSKDHESLRRILTVGERHKLHENLSSGLAGPNRIRNELLGKADITRADITEMALREIRANFFAAKIGIETLIQRLGNLPDKSVNLSRHVLMDHIVTLSGQPGDQSVLTLQYWLERRTMKAIDQLRMVKFMVLR